MKRTFKKSLSLVLAIIMVFAVMPIAGAADHTHVYNQYETTPAGTGHWSKCSCGTVDYSSYEQCSGGTATCASGAICDKCKTEYTAKSDNHAETTLVAEPQYLKTPANCKNFAVYYKVCTACGQMTNETGNYGLKDPNAHVYSTGVSNGNKTHKAVCDYCGTQSETASCYDDDPVVTEGNCTTGTKTVNTCEVCNYSWEDTQTAPGHDYTKESGVTRLPATCTDYITYWYMCKVCEANAKDDPAAADKYYEGTMKLPHEYDKTVQNENTIVSPATCKEEAVYYYSCQCGAIGTNTFKSSKGTHQFGAYTYNNDATCTKDGTETAQCVYGCGTTDTKDKVGSQLPHTYTRHLEKEDRIKETGNCLTPNKYFTTCTTCDAFSDSTFFTGSKNGDHDFTCTTLNDGNITYYLKDNATCTSLAVFYKYCATCGLSSKGTDFEATFTYGTMLDHNYVEKIHNDYIRVQAKCDSEAIYSKSCSVCGHAKVPADVNVTDPTANVAPEDIFYGTKLGHDLKVTQEKIEPKCAVDGKEAVWTCQRTFEGQACGHQTGGEVIPKLGHKFEKVRDYRDATCKIDGQYGQNKCSVCSSVEYFDKEGKTVTIPLTIKATGHSDSDDDMICDKCDSLLEEEDLCECICHNNTGFMFFVVWFLKWFWKFTGTKQVCDCGTMHY